MRQDKIDSIVEEIIKLAKEEISSDPVRNLHSVTVAIDNRIEDIMNKIRENERNEKS